MQKETGDLSPFQERVNVNLFFSGAHRRKLLEEVKKSIFDGVPVITITGDEGSGKTMICRMVEKELPADFSCVYLPNSLESFDDVVRVLALGLGTENSKKPGSTEDLVLEIKQHLSENGRTLVAIFDQSERMYLATIERIRKMLDSVNATCLVFQIIFAGRPSLLENLKHLLICDFKIKEEKNYTLENLGLSETYAYLNHCVQQRTPATGKNIFTPEAAKKIYTMTQGNFRMTNMLAEKSLEAFDSETSFMVLLDNVNEGKDAPGKKKPAFRRSLSGHPWLTGVIIVSVIVVSLLLYNLVNNNQLPTGTEQSSETVSTLKGKDSGTPLKEVPALEVSSSAPEIATENTDKKEQKPSAPAVVEQPPVSKKTSKPADVSANSTVEEKAGLVEQKNNKDTALIEQTKIENFPQSAPPQLQTDTELEKPLVPVEPAEQTTVQIEVTAAPIKTPTPIKSKESAPVTEEEKTIDVSPEKKLVENEVNVDAPQDTDSQQPLSKEQMGSIGSIVIESATVSEETVAEETAAEETEVTSEDVSDDLQIFADVKKRMPPPEGIDSETKKVVKIAPVKVKLKQTGDTSGGAEANAAENSADLYQQRVDAASRWLAGLENDKHTVQLMVLTSEQAEQNLKNRFEQQEYKDIADDLYIIIHKDTSVFVFYGEYPDVDTARRARNTLPVFLRKHNPYAISVEDAVKKATSEQ